MRFYLLPISTRRTLIYCEHGPAAPGARKSIPDRIVDKASETWTSWERAEKGWKKSVTRYGSVLLNRIPFEEWGLKTVPGLSRKVRNLEMEKQTKVEVRYPAAFLEKSLAPGILQRIATERQGLHRKKMWWSVVGMPLCAPFALVPVVPNFPFFYLAFRAWSHWKALSGSKHIEFLTKNDLLTYRPSSILDQMYAAGLLNHSRDKSRVAPTPTPNQTSRLANTIGAEQQDGAKEVMLLRRWNGKLLAEQLRLPNLEIEIERAVDQVEGAIKAKEKEEAETAANQAAADAGKKPDGAAQAEKEKTTDEKKGLS